MKLKHFEFENIIDFDKANIYSLEFEDCNYLFKMANELICQVNGEYGEFVLSDNLKEVKLDKNMYVFTDYFNIDFNSKQILNVVVKRLSELSVDSEHKHTFVKIKEKISEYLKDLLFDFDMPIIYDELDEEKLLKAINVRLAYTKKSLLELLIDYLNILSNNLNLKVFTFVNLKPLLNNNDYELLCKHICYSDLKVIFIDFINTGKYANGEILIEIDADKCEFMKTY